MMDKDDKYVVIKDVKRINVRYYLIQIDNKSYIIDYANPKDLRTYFSWIFIASNNQWKIYDVTGKERDYSVKSSGPYQNRFLTVFVFLLMICYIINIDSAPAHLNLRALTMDTRIVQYWPLSILFVFAIGFALFLILYRKQTEVNRPKQSQILIRNYRIPRKWILNILRWWDIVSYNVL
jgi:hypothetical protein